VLEACEVAGLVLTGGDTARAVAKALGARTDLAELHKDIDRARLDLKFTGNQRLPDVRVNATYVASGLGGTQVLRTGGFPGSIVGPGAGVGFGSVLNQLITGRYSTWSVGLSVSRPIGASVEEANHARSRLQQARATQELKSAESRAIQQVRDAWRQIETSGSTRSAGASTRACPRASWSFRRSVT
jgi:outer membrane protein TolC